MKKKPIVIASVSVAVALGLFFFVPKNNSQAIDTSQNAVSEKSDHMKLSPQMNDDETDKKNVSSDGSSPSKELDYPLPSSPQLMRAKIRELADHRTFPYALLSAILNGPFPRDIKFMALQAFSQVHHMDPSEIHKHTSDLIDFIERNLSEMDESDRGVVNRVLGQMNDDQNPNKEIAYEYFEEKFNEYRNTDKEKAALFLNNFMDQDKVYEVMKESSDKLLVETAQNRLPQIASPKMVKEIIDSERFTADQQATALQRLARDVDGEPRANGMSDADAIIAWAKDLDNKKGTGNRFYKAALHGISASNHKNREQFLVEGMKRSLQPYREKKGALAYSSIPELAAMFGFLVEMPERSTAYDFFIAELDRLGNAPKCPETQAESAVLDLITFWQDACERSVDDCPEKSKSNAYFQTISDKYMKLKGRCPSI